ncbi:hypothetical protein Fmac_007490 [Flemingia macrophylla]|uniref:60S acidic ribosomal protein P1 n=1 Tax=Flemingia macrophylla TaxID=520843 RepID=A0ABD1MUQ6_9FABA
MDAGVQGCGLAMLILHDEEIPITAEKINALLKAANVSAESYWPSLFAKLAQSRNIEDLVFNSGGAGAATVAAPVATAAGAAAAEAPAAVEKKEEEKEESDDDMGFGLFD